MIDFPGAMPPCFHTVRRFFLSFAAWHRPEKVDRRCHRRLPQDLTIDSRPGSALCLQKETGISVESKHDKVPCDNTVLSTAWRNRQRYIWSSSNFCFEFSRSCFCQDAHLQRFDLTTYCL